MGSIGDYIASRGGGGGAGLYSRGSRQTTYEPPDELSEKEKLELAQSRLAQELGKLRGKWKKDDDNHARIKYEALMGKYASGVDKKFLKKYGIPDKEIDDYTFDSGFGGGSDLSWQEKAVGLVGKAGEYAGRPEQAVFRGLQELGIGAYNASYGDDARKGEGVLRGMWSGLSGRGDPINTREAFGMDKDAGGTLGDVADFGGQVLLDPLNFVSAGTGDIAKAGIRKLSEEAATRGFLDQSGKRLGQALSKFAPEERALMRQTIKEGVSPAARGEAGLLRRNLTPALLGKRGEDAAEYIAEKTMKKLGRRGRGGLVLAGRTVVPGGKISQAIGWADRVSVSTADLSKGNKTVQTAADDFAREYRGRPLKVVEEESAPAFRINDEDAYAQELDELYAYMTDPEKMGLKVEYVDKVEAYDNVADLRRDVASGRVKIAAAEGAAEDAQLGQVVKEQAVEDVFGRALSGSEDPDVAKGYVGQLFSDKAMVAEDGTPVGFTDEAADAAGAASPEVLNQRISEAEEMLRNLETQEATGQLPQVTASMRAKLEKRLADLRQQAAGATGAAPPEGVDPEAWARMTGDTTPDTPDTPGQYNGALGGQNKPVIIFDNKTEKGYVFAGGQRLTGDLPQDEVNAVYERVNEALRGKAAEAAAPAEAAPPTAVVPPGRKRIYGTDMGGSNFSTDPSKAAKTPSGRMRIVDVTPEELSTYERNAARRGVQGAELPHSTLDKAVEVNAADVMPKGTPKAQESIAKMGVTGSKVSNVVPEQFAKDFQVFIGKWTDDAGRATEDLAENADEMRASLDKVEEQWRSQRFGLPEDAAKAEAVLKDVEEWRAFLDNMDPQIRELRGENLPTPERLQRAEQRLAAAKTRPAAPPVPEDGVGLDELRSLEEIRADQATWADSKWAAVDAGDTQGVQDAVDRLNALEMEEQVTQEKLRGGASGDPRVLSDLQAERREAQDELSELLDMDERGVLDNYDRVDELEDRITDLDAMIEAGGVSPPGGVPKMRDLDLRMGEKSILNGGTMGSIHPFYEIRPEGVTSQTVFGWNGEMNEDWFDYLVEQDRWDEYLGQFDALKERWEDRLDRIENQGEFNPDGLITNGRSTRSDVNDAIEGIDPMREALENLRSQIGKPRTAAADSPRVVKAQAEVDALRAQLAAEDETARLKAVADAEAADRAERMRTARGRAEVEAEDRVERVRQRIVGTKAKRLEKAEEKARKAQGKVDATREKIQDRLDADPNTPTFGMGKKLGEAGKKADAAAAEEVRATARAERANKRVDLLGRKLERARGRLTETGADLQEQSLDAGPIVEGGAEAPAVTLADLRAQEKDLVDQAAAANRDGDWARANDLDSRSLEMRSRIMELEDAGVPETQKIADVPGAGPTPKDAAGGTGAAKPGFRGGKKLGRAEQKVADLEAALKEARVQRARLEDEAQAAREASWGELDRYNATVADLRGKGRKPVKGFGEGKSMEKAEAKLRQAVKDQAAAESALEDAKQRFEDVRPVLEEGVGRKGDRAARDAALRGRALLVEQGELGDTVSNTGATALRETTLERRGLRRKILESRAGGVLNRGVNTRADLRYRPGQEGARLAAEAGDVAPQVAGLYRDKVEPVIRRLSELVRTAKVDADTLREMYATLEEGGDAVARRVGDLAWPPADRVGSPQAARDLLQEMDDVRRSFTQALVDAGIVDEGILNNVDRYVHRTLTDAGRRALGDTARSGEAAWAKAGRYGTDLAQGGALEEREFLANLPINEIEAHPQAELVRKRAGLEAGEKLYEDDPVIQTARRTASAYGAVAEVENYRLLSQIRTDAGEALMVTARKSDKRGFAAAKRRASRLGYEAIPLSEAADVVAWAPKDLVPELIRMRQVVYNDETLREIGKFFDGWNRLWKRSATIPLTSGTGFVMRNMQGNIINNYLKGITSIDVYRQAFHYQRLEKRTAKVMAEKGLTFEKALADMGITGREAELAKMARQHGVWSEGFIRADLGDDQLAALAPSTRRGQIRAALNPLGQNSPVVRYGRNFNEVVENNARMAHFIQKFDETGSAIDAARSMRETLFDYSDLTPTEQRLLKRVNAFYTWTRKNLPLQMRTWIESPARQHRVIMAENTFLHGDAENGDQRFNAFALDRGQGPAPAGLRKLLGAGDNGVLVGVDTPLEAALDTVNPIVQTLAVTPGVEKLLPDDLKPRGGSWTTKAKMITGNIIGQTSGGPAEAINQLYEYATGTDTFTGQSFVTPQGKTIFTKQDAMLALTSILAPGIGKSVNQAQGWANIGRYRDRPTSYTRSMLARMTLGLAVTPQDERTEKGEAWRRYAEVQEAISEAFPDGLPTVEELRDRGYMPKQTRRRISTGGSLYGR